MADLVGNPVSRHKTQVEGQKARFQKKVFEKNSSSLGMNNWRPETVQKNDII